MRMLRESILPGLLLLLLATPVAAQDASSSSKPLTEEEILSMPPSAWNVGARPDPIEKDYPQTRKKVWKAVLKVLKKMDIPIDFSNAASGVINTKLIPFAQDRGWGNLATRPPQISRERPIVETVGLRAGNFSVSITLSDNDKGTHILVSAYLEEDARYVPLQKHILVERYSNGTLEHLVLSRLDDELK